MIQEEPFADEFLRRDGLNELISIIQTAHGNILAVNHNHSPYLSSPASHREFVLDFVAQYALMAMQNLMELDHGWSTLSPEFILRIVQILSSEQSLINVCRPATAILKKLVEADPMSRVGASSSSRIPPAAPPGSVYQYGFEVVWEQMCKEPKMLETVVSRLGSQDTTMALYRYVFHPPSINASDIPGNCQHDADQLAHGALKRGVLGRVHHRVGEIKCAQVCHRTCETSIPEFPRFVNRCPTLCSVSWPRI